MIRVLTVGLLFALTLSASAQTRVTIEPNSGSPQPRGDSVRVQVNVSFQVPGMAGDSEEAVKAQENARRTLYTIADRECGLLKEIIATECRLEAVNVNVNRQRNPGQDQINANGSMTYRVTLK